MICGPIAIALALTLTARWWSRDEMLVAVINDWIKIGLYAVKYRVMPI